MTRSDQFSFALLMMILALSSPLLAQTSPPCKPIPQDRSITFCYPIDDANLTVDSVLQVGWIKDSQPHTASYYKDGQHVSAVPDTFDLTLIGNENFGFDDKLHTFTIIVTDSQGSFQKSVSFRETLQLPCAMPSTDRSVVMCKPSVHETDTSPVRIAAVARSSNGIDWMQVWIDGAKPVDSTQHVTGTADLKMINQFYYLGLGTHHVTVVAKQSDGTSIKTSHDVKVVSYTP